MNMSAKLKQAYNILIRDNFCLGCEYRFDNDGCYEQECYWMAVEPFQELMQLHSKQIEEMDKMAKDAEQGF